MTPDELKIKVIKAILILFATACILLTLKFAAAQTNLDAGMCYDIPANTTFNISQSICANNCSQINISLMLYPGGNINNQTGNCNVNAQCGLQNETPARCTLLNKHLDNGEIFTLDDGVCDLSIDCHNKQCNDDCTIGDPRTFEEKLEVKYNADDKVVDFTFGSKHFPIPIGNESSYTDYLSYTCPACPELKTNFSAVEGIKLSMEQCKEIIPLYCEDITSLMIRQNDELRAQLKEAQGQLDNAQLDLLRIKEQHICIPNDQYVDFKLENIQLRNESDKCSYQAGKKDKDIENKNNFQYELGFFCLVEAGIIAYLYFNPRMGKKKSAVG